jgi:hypothetical protein
MRHSTRLERDLRLPKRELSASSKGAREYARRGRWGSRSRRRRRIGDDRELQHQKFNGCHFSLVVYLF